VPTGIAIDASNNLYVSSGVGGSGVVIEKPGISGTTVTLTTLNTPVALAVAPDGSLYIGDQHNNMVYRYSGGTTTPAFSNSSITKLTGIHLDNTSNLYVTSQSNATVLKVAVPATVYTPRLDMGSAAVGSTRTITVNLNVPGGNSVSTIGVADNAGNSEWTLPNGNSCSVVSGACSFTVNFKPAYPGMRDGTLTITDSLSNTLSYILYGSGQGPEAVLLNGTRRRLQARGCPRISARTRQATSTSSTVRSLTFRSSRRSLLRARYPRLTALPTAGPHTISPSMVMAATMYPKMVAPCRS